MAAVVVTVPAVATAVVGTGVAAVGVAVGLAVFVAVGLAVFVAVVVAALPTAGAVAKKVVCLVRDLLVVVAVVGRDWQWLIEVVLW